MDDLKAHYKRNDNFVFRKIDNETILVPIKENVADMGFIYNLNEAGAFIWEHLDGTRQLCAIKNMMTEEFEVSSEQAEEDIIEFVNQLEKIEAIIPIG
ncbi:MAG: PqqD family protein [bacterium]